MQQGNLLRYP